MILVLRFWFDRGVAGFAANLTAGPARAPAAAGEVLAPRRPPSALPG